MTVEEIQQCLLPGEEAGVKSLFPVSCTWPMGFAWSSFIAQEFLLDTCRCAELSESQIMSCDCPTPLDCGLVFAAATDDVMIFSSLGPGCSLNAAQRLDQQFELQGITCPPHQEGRERQFVSNLCGRGAGGWRALGSASFQVFVDAGVIAPFVTSARSFPQAGSSAPWCSTVV